MLSDSPALTPDPLGHPVFRDDVSSCRTNGVFGALFAVDKQTNGLVG
jgi:hypothetical protein